jgi:hypothetical protein
MNRTRKVKHLVELKNLKKEQWSEAAVDFTASKGSDGAPRGGHHVDEIHFLLQQGTELLIDDVLLYDK